MIKRYVGLDFLDLVIQFGITMAVAVALAHMAPTEEPIAIGATIAGSLGILAWRRGRALRQLRAEPPGLDSGRMAALEDRLLDLDRLEARVLELEERADFAERLLVQHRERGAELGPGAAP